MEQSIKFSEEELNKIKTLQTAYAEKTAQFGNLKVRRILLEQELNSVNKTESQLAIEYVKLQDDESVLVAELTKKYGDGSLSLETGEFIPAK